MVRVARGKALVAKLRAQAGVRDPEALAAWLGRVKKLKRGGLSTKAAMKAANKAGKNRAVTDVESKLTPKQREWFDWQVEDARGRRGLTGEALEKFKAMKLAVIFPPEKRQKEKPRFSREDTPELARARPTSKKQREIDQRKARKQQVKLNDHLRRYGYRWQKTEEVPSAEDIDPRDSRTMDRDDPLMAGHGARWVLLGPDGRKTTVEAALAEIKRRKRSNLFK